jgi:photosystem II stability/assembly factor-like uncharacterized protein
MSVKRFLSLLATFVLLAVPAAAGTGHWTPIGPSGSFFHASPVYTHPGAPGTVWINLYKSADRGISWSWASAPLPADFETLAADPSAPGAVWVAGSSAFLHSKGNGAPWVRVSNSTYVTELGTERPGSIIAAQETPGAVYLTTYQRLLGSLDGGITWRTLLGASDGRRVLNVIPAAPGILYVITEVSTASFTEQRLLKTRNNGRTWTEIACPATSPSGCGFVQLVTSQGAVFATTYAGGAGLLRSPDGGRTWHRVLGGIPGEPSVLSLLKNAQFPGTLWAITGYPTTLWLSLDNGVTWTRRNEVPVSRLAASGPEGSVLYAYSDAGLARSLNGGRTWVDAFPVISDPDRPPSRISFQKGNPSRMAFVYGHELFLSNNGGKTWKWMPKAPGGMNGVVIDPADPNRMYAAGFYQGAVTTNGGQTWSRMGPPEYVELLVRGRGQTLFAGGYGVFRSRDNGKTWLRVLAETSPRNRDAAQIVQKLVVDPANPDFVYALVFLDEEFYPNHGPMNGLPSILWQSRDGGTNWQKIAVDLDAFALDSESSRLWMVRGSGVFASDDRGAHWRLMSQAPVDVDSYWITDLVAPPGLPGTLYLTGGPGLLRTRDEGRTWEIAATGGGMLLELAPDDPRTVFGMTHEGLFQTRLPE